MPSKKSNKKKFAYPPINSSALSGLPNVTTATVRFATKRNLGVSGAFLETKFRANGPWDPDTQVGGSTPMGWSIWQLKYNHQITIRSRIKVDLVRTSEDIAMGLYLADDGDVPYSGLSPYIEAGRGTWDLVSKNLTSKKSVKCDFDCKKFFNCGDIKDRVATLGSTTSAYPEDEATFVFWFDAIGVLPESTKVDVVVVIDYHVEFSEPLDLVTINNLANDMNKIKFEQRALSYPVEKPRCGSEDLESFDLGSDHSGEGNTATSGFHPASGPEIRVKPATALYKLW